MPRKLELTTSRLKLFVPAIDKAHAVLAYFVRNREHLAPTDPPKPPGFHTLAFWEKRLLQHLEDFERESAIRFYFERLARPGEVIGACSLTQFSRGPFQACYLGYSISGECEGQGLMFEALQEVIRYAFEELHIHRIMANHLTDNRRSANVLRRLGFRVDGTSPDYLYIHGRWQEHVLNSLTNQKWTPREQDRELFT